MVQLSILYPIKENAIFDWNYYLDIHMPLSVKLHGEALKSVTISKGLEGIEGAPVGHIAMTNMLFDSVNSFIEAFTPHAEILQGDMKNYTNIQPVIQFSEVVLYKKILTFGYNQWNPRVALISTEINES